MNALDTNVLIYFYDERDVALRTAATAMVTSLRDGVLLWQVACEFLAASRRLEASGLTSQVVWQRLSELRGLFPLILPTDGVLDRARRLMSHHQIHFWDAMIYAACLEAGVRRLYSQDLPGESIEALEIVNPFR